MATTNDKVMIAPPNSLKEEHIWRDWFTKIANKFKAGATKNVTSSNFNITVDQGLVTSVSATDVIPYVPPTGLTGTYTVASLTTITVTNGIITAKTP